MLALQFQFKINETVIEKILLHNGHELEERSLYPISDEIEKQYAYLQQKKEICFVAGYFFLTT